MKAFSPTKIFTSVCFILIMGFVSAGFGESKEKCEAKCNQERKNFEKECATESSPSSCVRGKISDCKAENCADKESNRETGNQCTTAYNEYIKKSGDFRSACSGLEKGSANTCEKRLESCNSQMGGASAKGLQSGGMWGVLFNMSTSAYMQSRGLNPPTDGDTQGGKALSSCMKFSNKETRAAKKDMDQKIERIEQKISDIKEKIEKEKEEILKENARLSKETNEIDVERQKVDEKVKEAIRKVDEKKGDRMRKLNEDVAKSSIAIRNINNAIIKQKEVSESIKFDYAQKVVQFSEDKVNKQCKAAVETAKACFVKSSKGQKSMDPKDTCSNFSLTAKGAKGTAELKNKLKDIQEACFEQAKLSTDKARFEQQKSLRSIETDIAEKTNQVKDAQNDLERKQNDFKSIGAESDKEKSDEQAAADKQLENFTKKLEGISKDVTLSIERRNKKMENLEKEVTELLAKKLPEKLGITESGDDIEVVTSEATKAISEGYEAYSSAVAACCDGDTESRQTKNRCSQLQKSKKYIESSGRSTKDADGEQ